MSEPAMSPADPGQRRLPVGIIIGLLLMVALLGGGLWYMRERARDAAEAEARKALDPVADRILLVSNGPHVEVVNLLQPIDAALFARIGELHHLQTCKISDCQIVDDQLADLTGLSDLIVLQVERCPGVTSQGVTHVARLSKLERLFADGTSIDDAGLAQLSSLRRLTTLDVSHTKITDAGLSHLTQLPKLEVLRLSGTAITDAGVEHLKAIKSLRLLNISGTQITAAGKQALLAANKDVKLEETAEPGNIEANVE